MGTSIDYNALRAQTMGSENDEEAVTVNTRALIDKVLARYSGEWTVLRELLQNAADAAATKVTIKFETLPSPSIPVPQTTEPSSALKHILLHHTLKRLLVTNNGQPFGSNDWTRLKRIAEGNPDETKIGAFGVGFYSVFADCEEPFVSSGKEAMAFYWKGNSLFTRRLQLPETYASSDTSFVLDYRSSTSPIPGLLPLCQFLASSLTFVGLEVIELYLDEWKLLRLSKKAAPTVDVIVPKEVETRTHDRLMRITGVSRETAQLDAEWLNIVGWKPVSPTGMDSGWDSHITGKGSGPTTSLRSFFSRLTTGPVNIAAEKAAKEEKVSQKVVFEDLAGLSKATVFLRVSTATIRTSISDSFSHELERATKKPAPQSTRLALLTSSFESVVPNSSNVTDVFASVLPSKSGRIFIGFPTHQTTGLNAHISAPSVIPTVERESIDLNARWLREWNIAMLRVAGIVCRIAWAGEMQLIKDKLSRASNTGNRNKVSMEDILRVLPEAVHALNQFTFRESTPSNQVGEIVEEAFWTCNKKASIDILSSCGILPSQQVRIATEDLSFVDGIPVLPKPLMEQAKDFVDKLTNIGIITEITVSDIKKELEAKALTGQQLGEFLKWLVRKARSSEVDESTIRSLLEVTVANDNDSNSGQGRVIVLGEMKHFINPSRIPAEVPVPSTTMPFKFTKSMSKVELEALGWEDLQLVPWLRWLVENTGGRGHLPIENDLTASPSFAASLLQILSKQWEGLSQSSKATVVNLLSSRTVMPTKLGLRTPTDSYFPNVKLFDDLPVVSGLHNVKDKLLVALGVRKTIELGVIFERLLIVSENNSVPSEGKWSHVDLIRYLASVRDDIPPDDIKRLKTTPICPAEVGQDPSKGSSRRYVVSDLFEPKDTLRSLHLPILQWPGVYRSGSVDGKFLSSLGLRTVPTVPELIEIMARSATEGKFALRDHALTYLIINHHINGYASYDTTSIATPYLPLQGEDTKRLVTPSQCFTNQRAAVLGFELLRSDLHPHALKFGVQSDPPMLDCINRLLKRPPDTRRNAKEVFGYFASRLAEIKDEHVQRLGGASFVPIFRATQSSNDYLNEKLTVTRYLAPRECFLGDSQTYGEIFTFVDLGPEANSFLLKCGSKHEPNKLELAQLMVREPARLVTVFQSTEKYLILLRTLADSFPILKKDRELLKEMKRSQFLLAYTEVPSKPAKSGTTRRAIEDDFDEDDEDEEASIRTFQLASAGQITIVDDIISYNLFKDNLLAAPQEELLEDFYLALGSPLLSALVEEQPRVGAIDNDQRPATKLRKRVMERTRLFLNDCTREIIKHDARWLEKNLKVEAVALISLRRSLKLTGRILSHNESRSAAVSQDQRKGWILSITADNYDLFEVSQALVHLLLTRPKPQYAMLLDMFLGTKLEKLRARGYNVERILRQKAAEARIAEDHRQKQLEEEKRKIKERETSWNGIQAQVAAREQDKSANMPGLFPDSPEQKKLGQDDRRDISPTDEQRGKRPRGLFSEITKRLGFEDGRRPSQQLQNLVSNGNGDGLANGSQKQLMAPPPYSVEDAKGAKRHNQPETVTAPHQLQQNLLSAIEASRAHDSSTIFSHPQTNEVKETNSYCDERPGRDLSFFADSSRGIKIFLSNNLTDKNAFMRANSSALNDFASILLDCGNVFALRVDSLHIFYDDSGSTIGFNRKGSIFFNYRYFENLHLPNVQQGVKAEALVYWWVVLCHELAHNLVDDHSSNHSYYTENFVVQYFGKMMAKVAASSTDAAAR
ncbi:MAG: hypothetical protein M1830_003690 [Pleopsidium flavum]|nr:MAG: hypothetical protein M1830_003690 [Pleopsidium flavum]